MQYKRFFIFDTMGQEGMHKIFFEKDDNKMIIKEGDNYYAIDINDNGKLDDMFYLSTKIWAYKGCKIPDWMQPNYIKYNTSVIYSPVKITFGKGYIYKFEQDEKANVVQDNAFFLIFLSPIFDSPIKQRILQFLSYLCLDDSIECDVNDFILKDLASLLKYKQSENQ